MNRRPNILIGCGDIDVASRLPSAASAAAVGADGHGVAIIDFSRVWHVILLSNAAHVEEQREKLPWRWKLAVRPADKGGKAKADHALKPAAPPPVLSALQPTFFFRSLF
jgi:hypothetical protein